VPSPLIISLLSHAVYAPRLTSVAPVRPTDQAASPPSRSPSPLCHHALLSIAVPTSNLPLLPPLPAMGNLSPTEGRWCRWEGRGLSRFLCRVIASSLASSDSSSPRPLVPPFCRCHHRDTSPSPPPLPWPGSMAHWCVMTHDSFF
jgi:hypothetical protein